MDFHRNIRGIFQRDLMAGTAQVIRFDPHCQNLCPDLCFPQPCRHSLCQRQKDQPSCRLIGHIKGNSGRVSIPFVGRRFQLYQRDVSPIGKCPDYLPVFLQMLFQQGWICMRQISHGINAQIHQLFLRGFSHKEQFSDWEYPHFSRNFLLPEGMHPVRLFKIRRHLCQ